MAREEVVISERESIIQSIIIKRLRKKFEDGDYKYFIHTFGCQMNVHDSEKLRGILEQIGYRPAASEREADFILYNTCAIREGAELKVYGKIGHLKTLKKQNPRLMIALCGCMMQQETVLEKIKKSFSHVDMIFGTHNIYKLAEIIEKRLKSKKMVIDVWDSHKEIVEDLPIRRDFPFKASVNITYGCNNYCTFCIVPYVRGRERSRPYKDIVNEVKSLVDDGVLEITLLGQNVNSYGRGLKDEENISFTDLLKKLEEIEGLEILRFMTSHPKDLSDELIDWMGKSKKLAPHFHLPLQSGSSKILKKMNRAYSKEHYLDLVKKLRKARPDIAITTDIIVGFPGETEEDFQDTLDVVNEVAYDMAYTFIYSKRGETRATKMEDQVEHEVSSDRLKRLMKAVNDKAYEVNQRLIGSRGRVLVEEVDGDKLTGRLANNHLVHFKGTKDLLGKIVEVEIVGGKSFYLLANLCKEEVLI